MKNEILKSLIDIESKYNVKVLYACESGSRAWGFPSSDSDFDVRFIYVHNRQWYLSLEDKKDTINAFLPNDLDVVGWDIRKALVQFGKSNVSLYEWFDSPIVYSCVNEFLSSVKKLIDCFFNPRKAMYHYISLGNTALEKYYNGQSISVKKLMYVLRAFLACEWVLKKSSMPPTLFEKIYSEVASDGLQKQIEKLVQAKINLTEKSEIKVEGAIKDFIENSSKYCELAQKLCTSQKDVSFSVLNQIVYDFIK